MTGDPSVTPLLGSTVDFERAVLQIQSADFIPVALAFLRALDTAELPNGEKERRLNVILSRRGFTGDDFRSIAHTTATLTSPVIRNAVTTMVPAEYRRLIHRATASEISGPTRPAPITTATIERRERQPEEDGDHSFSAVIILSAAIDPATQTLLTAAGYVPLRFDTVAALLRFLETSSDVCAFLIDSTFLERLDADAQRSLFNALARYSTFCLIRTHATRLLISRAETGRIISQARCSMDPPAFDQLNFVNQQALHEAELPLLDAARSRLRFGPIGRFLPEQLSTTQLQLLGAAMMQYVRRKRFDHHATLDAVSVRFLEGGGGATIALVRVNGLRWPVIVKIDQYAQIAQEALRFMTFVQVHNRELRPEVHLHGGAALIIFDVIAVEQPGVIAPAPTFANELQRFWYAEMLGDGLPDVDALIAAAADAARDLAALNVLKCDVPGFKVLANPYLAYIKKCEAAGLTWGFDLDALDARDRAEAILNENADAAVCHGDAHLGNVLVDGARGHIIDYAYSGPGHPCADLAKLELSFFLKGFNPFGGDADIISLQRSLSDPATNFETLRQRHGDIMRSRSNELCVRLCLAVRDAVERVLHAHSLDWPHYRAVKLLQAWQALQSPNLPQSMVRCVIQALSTETHEVAPAL